MKVYRAHEAVHLEVGSNKKQSSKGDHGIAELQDCGIAGSRDCADTGGSCSPTLFDINRDEIWQVENRRLSIINVEISPQIRP